MEKNVVLCEGNFLSLEKIVADDYEYEYVHESRCDGNIVAVLVTKNNEMLIRKETTPCWGKGPHINSLTGGWEQDKHSTPIDTVIAELREEAGIILNDESIIKFLGTCNGTKSCDTVYHLFTVDLSDPAVWEQVEPEPDDWLEDKESSEWVPLDSSSLEKSNDPILYVLWHKAILGK